MVEVYGATGIPSDSIEVRSGGTVAVSAAFETTLGLVGGYDTANGTATEGAVTTVESTADADTEFGADSELAEQSALAFQNGAGTIYAVAVSEITVTGEAAGGQSGTLSNVPVFDPNIHDEESISATDTGGTNPTVTIVYDSPPSTPTDADTVNVNPVTGEFEFDAAAAGSYEFDYAYGDYGGAITEVVKEVPRIVTVLTENTSVANDLLTELNTYGTDFDFMHGVVGALPEVDASTYTDPFDDRRLSVVAPSRGYTDAAETNEQRTLGAVGGKQAGKALGDSTTYGGLGGFASLRTAYTNSQLADLVDAQVLPLKQGGGIKIIKDMTTSTDAKFERIYASEIIDEATEISHQISQDFVGDRNTDDNRLALRESHTSSYAEMQNDDLLEAYNVAVSKGANDFEVTVDIGLDVIGIMDLIDVTITVGDVVKNEGAA